MQLIGYGPSELIKYCDEKYNIKKGCNTIRVGTLFGFRTEENEKLRDEGEGEFEIKISFPELTEISPDWGAEIGTHGPGDAYIDKLVYQNGKIKIRGATVSGSSENCWIYCFSTKGDGVAGSITETHNSKWKIAIGSVDNFVKYLAELLLDSIEREDLPSNLRHIPIRRLARGLAFDIRVADINYTDREIKIDKEEDFPIERLRELKANMPFTKPQIFQEESEVRIAFFLKYEGQVVSIPDKPKILALRPIDSIPGIS